MDQEQQAKWDARHEAAEGTPEPARVLMGNAHLLPGQGRALDLACGLGGNALFLAERGLETTGWDLSPVAIERMSAAAGARGLQIEGEARDVVERPPEPQRFDVICVSHFLERALTRDLIHALRPGGLLFYQTFTRACAQQAGPRNPAYRLADNELLHLFVPPLRLRAYREENRTGDPSLGSRGMAFLVAQAPFAWSDRAEDTA
jgi:SAM-dependent methyltransferase